MPLSQALDAADRRRAEHRNQDLPDPASVPRMTIYVCEQCDGTGYLKGGQRCPCREEDDEAAERRRKMQVIRPELPELPRTMQDLPRDKRGYPVPWFVDW